MQQDIVGIQYIFAVFFLELYSKMNPVENDRRRTVILCTEYVADLKSRNIEMEHTLNATNEFGDEIDH